MTLVQLEDWERDLLVDTLKSDIADAEFAPSEDFLKLIRKLEQPEKAEIKLKFQVFVRDNGDGSASPLFFNKPEEAREYSEGENQWLCDDIFQETIVINGLGKIKEIPKREEYEEEKP